MSCSTTSLLAGTITTNTLTVEDPYIFTETVPTTPPTLFSNSQKSRNRFESKSQQQRQQQNLNTGIPAVAAANCAANALKESFYVKPLNYGAQTQASTFVASATVAAATKKQHTQTQFVNPQTAVLGVLNTNNVKKYETKAAKTLSSVQRQQKHVQQLMYAPQNENIIEKQQQRQQQQPKTLSTTPPPLLLSHTPSLWQTPLILESSCGTVAAQKGVKLESASKVLQQQQHQSQLPNVTAIVTPVNTLNAATPLMISATVPLPPSNFHHTTLAQHLQKLQCLKKPKKTNMLAANAGNAATFVQPNPPPQFVPTSSLSVAALSNSKQQTVSSNQAQQHQQHSATDLNEIPVNVIFRAATTPTTDATPNAGPKNITPTPTTAPANKIEKACKKPAFIACAKTQNPPPAKQRKGKKQSLAKASNPALAAAIATVATGATNTQLILSNSNTNAGHKHIAAKKRQTNIQLPHAKAQKRFKKTNFFSSLLNENATAVPDISLSTKAVAVVKRPYGVPDNDDADENELPFCMQRHWFNAQWYRSPNDKHLSREERLNEYKSALRRQAMQLLATRSLQRLPYHVARKRLICVDTLLRKYRDCNKNRSSPSKQCEVESCKNVALSMTTICQQHIAKNSKQSIFVMCSAKIAKSSTAQPTTCNNPVLNIQKQYAPPLCCLHLSQQQKQQQQQQALNCALTAKACESQMHALKSTQQMARKRKFSAVSAAVPINTSVEDTLHLASRTQMQRKNSTTSLESIASNSQSSFGSVSRTTSAPAVTSFATSNMLSPPALAPLSYSSSIVQRTIAASVSVPVSTKTCTIDPYAEQEINKLVAQFAMAAAAKSVAPSMGNNNNTINSNQNNNNFNSFNFMNTNSNSNLTSSGIGSSSSLPSTDELLSNCENSSAYASSSEDTGLGELSESELMAVSSIAENIGVNAIPNVGTGVGGGGFNDDDVGPDEIPLGDARLLEETDLVNVFGTLPVNLNELFNAVVQQDEREEVERALEIADKHLRSLQQGLDTNFLEDLLNANDDDILVDADDFPSNENLGAATLYLENPEKSPSNGVGVGNSGANNAGVMDIRGLLQT